MENQAIIAPPTAAELQQIARLLHKETGIVLAPGKSSMVQARLTKRMRALGMTEFQQYIGALERQQIADEKHHFVSALTTNVTQFFRERHHFDLLRDKALPSLLEGARNGRPVRIWSAGCSNGQEPYSIAMTIFEAMPDADKLNIKILATDIDRNVVAKAKAGHYSEPEVGTLDKRMKSAFMTSHSGGYTVSDRLKKLITFQELNLNKNWPRLGMFDAIFCRNVVIYFDPDTQLVLWKRFEELIQPGGWIFVGHSERIPKYPGSRLQTAGITTYNLAA